MSELRPLRPHQSRALDALRNSLIAGHKRPMLQAPTGFGKTLTAAHIIKRALDRGKRVAFTVPKLSLIGQTVAAFEAEGLHDIGVMQGNNPRGNPAARIQVCSVQTLAKRERPDVGLVLVDEAHEAYKDLFKWMKDAPELPFVGLSATPWTKGLGRHYDDLIVAATTADLIEQRYLSPFRVFAPHEPDLSKVRTVAGEYYENELADAMDTPTLVGDVVTEWQARGENRPTIAFAVNRAHALHMSQRFREVGIECGYIDCNTEVADREVIFERFRAGDVRVIANVNTLTVGIDLDVRCIIDARPTKSEMRYVQTIGRGLRTAPGKDHLIIIDHSGNVQRLGRVTDIHHDKLDSGKERGAVAERKDRPRVEVRLCPECKAVLPPRALACEACGHEIEAKNEIVHVDGALVELGTISSKSAAPSLMDQATFFAEVKFIAREKGYASGWAAHKFKERFSHWPNAPLVRLAEPQPPSLKTKNWLKSRAIAFAKARASGR